MSGIYPEMHWEELKALTREGWLVANHTRTHPYILKLLNEEGGLEKCIREIEGGREEMDARLGQRTRYFAYPRGDWHVDLENIVKQNHHSARLWRENFLKAEYTTSQADPYRITANNISMHVPFSAFRSIVDGAL